MSKETQEIKDLSIGELENMFFDNKTYDELSDEEKIDKLKNRIAILEQENTYLKKIRLIEKDALRKAQQGKNTN